jgi:hypothetical protein
LGKRDISSFSNIVEVHLGEEKKKCVGVWNRDMSVTSFVTVALPVVHFSLEQKKGVVHSLELERNK